MAKYRVKEKSFINDHLVDAGKEIEYDGPVHSNLEPLDKPAEKAASVIVRKDEDAASQERQRAAAAGVNLDDAEAFAKWKADQAALAAAKAGDQNKQ